MVEGRTFTLFMKHLPLVAAIMHMSPPWTARQCHRQRHLAFIAKHTTDLVHTVRVENFFCLCPIWPGNLKLRRHHRTRRRAHLSPPSPRLRRGVQTQLLSRSALLLYRSKCCFRQLGLPSVEFGPLASATVWYIHGLGQPGGRVVRRGGI